MTAIGTVGSRRNCPVVLATLLMALAARGDAQSPAITPGDHVRVSAPETHGKRLTGVIGTVGTDALTLGKTSAPIVIPWDNVVALDIRVPRTRKAGVLNGAKWGLIAGAALGVISLATPTPEGEDFDEGQLAFEAVVDAAVVGVAAGAIWPGKRWRSVRVAEARDASRLAAARPLAANPARATDADVTISGRAGMTPAVELSAGFSTPRSDYAQFPGLGVALAINGAWKPTLGAALVADAHVAQFATGVMGGPRLFLRSAPLFARRHILTYFAQFLAGSLRAERSGVVESTGGKALQPGVGIDFGARSIAGRLQIDQTIVRDGFVDDDRLPGRHAARLTGTRVLVGVTLRSESW